MQIRKLPFATEEPPGGPVENCRVRVEINNALSKQASLKRFKTIQHLTNETFKKLCTPYST